MTTTISNSEVTAIINHKGAELISFINNGSKKEYIWNGNPEFWGKHSPILFPIVGTLKNNCYTYKGKSFQMSRHGFARDMNFNLLYNSESEVAFSVVSNEETNKLYPFTFELQIIYTVHKSEIQITYKVFNHGLNTMLYSIGGHPALSLPNQFENYSLKFESNEKLIAYQLENDLLSNTTKQISLEQNTVPLSYSLFEKDALIFKELQSKQIQLLENKTPILNFKFKDFPNFGIWTKTKAPFICLEPWAGYSDIVTTSGAIEEKEGIQALESKTSKEYSFHIEIL
jgi:galactose mutarotase-like enzyme